MIIYKATNTINGKSYIGQTTNLKKRKQKHKDCARKGIQTYFYNAIRKYGINNFKWEVLCECISRKEMNEKEKYYIKKYDSFWKNNGYNLTEGGYDRQVTDKMRKKISDANKGEKHRLYGKHQTEETKHKISIAHKGKKLSKEHIKNMSIAFTGRKLSEETKKKMSLSRKGLKKSKEWIKKIAEGNRNKKISEETRRKLSLSHMGNIPSEETKRKMSLSHIGKNKGNKNGMFGKIPWNKGKKDKKTCINNIENKGEPLWL